jgi:TonB family protein
METDLFVNGRISPYLSNLRSILVFSYRECVVAFMKKRVALSFLAVLSVLIVAPNYAAPQESSLAGRKIVVRTAPQYPSLARSMNLQGNVKADVLVAPNGTVKSIEIKGGHPLLGQAAQNALREWKWEPAAHETHESVELKFTL